MATICDTLALAYERTSRLTPDELCESSDIQQNSLPHEIELQLLLLSGALGNTFIDEQGRIITVHDWGRWNRGAGPDFLQAWISIGNGGKIQGDIELDPSPEDWEKHGHGNNSNFDKVILHLVCLPTHHQWFTRNSRHEHIPHARIPAQVLASALVLPTPDFRQKEGLCSPLFSGMSNLEREAFLKQAAAYRLRQKNAHFLKIKSAVGMSQALYEAIATTLGYSENKFNMLHLARRTPISAIASAPEAILFGTAQFLFPVLQEKCTESTRLYHKDLWETWWKHRENFELSDQRKMTWKYTNTRPANHPQRRVAALATIAIQWKSFEALCHMNKHKELIRFLSSLTHPYWSTHFTLPSTEMKTKQALIGSSRTQDFIINHLCASDISDSAMELYFSIRAIGTPSQKVSSAIYRLFGAQVDTKSFPYAYQHQALLQMDKDFCTKNTCFTCPLPRR